MATEDEKTEMRTVEDFKGVLEDELRDRFRALDEYLNCYDLDKCIEILVRQIARTALIGMNKDHFEEAQKEPEF